MTTSGHMQVGRSAIRRTALVVWCALVAIALVLTVVAAVVGPDIWWRTSDAGEIYAWVVFGLAPVCLLISRVLPGRMKVAPATAEGIAVGRSLVANSLNGSIAMQAPLAWMISGKPIALGALAISLLGLLLGLPSERRWQKLCRDIVAQRGADLLAGDGAGPAAVTPGPMSKHALASLWLMGVGASSSLLLMGYAFWVQAVLDRRPGPIVGALLLLIQALMMGGFAIVRFARASTSRRPGWQRAQGVLLLLLSAVLLVMLAQRA